MRLKDKVAVVTGASSDIGISIVHRFVEEGAKVVLLGRKLETLKMAQSTVKNQDATASIQCDITNESQVLKTVEQIISNYGRIDVLINSAGAINDPVHFHEMPESEITKLININMLGTFKMTKAVLPSMREKKSGCIINLGSISSERAIPRVHLAVYSATKAAISMFTKSIAIEYARSNVRCNCINPGIINSGMIKPYLDDPKARKVLEDRLPLNRIGEPVDVANAAVYFASDEANWITGAILNVDGGKTASEG